MTRPMRLPRMLFNESEAPLLLVAASRLEALRLIPLLRALRASSDGGGALLVDADHGLGVHQALRELGLAADLRLPAQRGAVAKALAMYRLGLRIAPAMLIAGGAASAAAVGLAARALGIDNGLLGSAVDAAPRWRWHAMARLFTWFFAGVEAPKTSFARGRTLQLGDPLFDLCREQAAATEANGGQQRARVVWFERSLPDASGAIGEFLARHDARIDWIDAPSVESPPSLRRLGAIPHWRRLALLRRAQVVVTDDALTAFEARWMARAVIWTAQAPAPNGCMATNAVELPRALWQALSGSLAPRPLLEDGRAATRIAAAIRERIDSRALAGWLTRARAR